ANLGTLLELDAAVFFRNGQRANADLVGLFQNAQRQPVLGNHRPFELPVLLDEWKDHLIDEIAATLPHHPLLFGQAPVCRRTIKHRRIPSLVTKLKQPSGSTGNRPSDRVPSGCLRSSWRRTAAHTPRRGSRN